MNFDVIVCVARSTRQARVRLDMADRIYDRDQSVARGLSRLVFGECQDVSHYFPTIDSKAFYRQQQHE